MPRGGLWPWPTFHARVTMVGRKCLSLYNYLRVMHLPNLHYINILTWSNDITWWLVSSWSLKPQSDMHCNHSATSPRLKFILIAEESQLGFAVGRRLVGTWSATDRGLVSDWLATSWEPLCDLMQLVADRSGTGPRLIADQVNLKLW